MAKVQLNYPLMIILKKVRVNNLKGVDLTIQPGQFVVFTGVSGSGKSSLAFDTIYAEGQRRYIESLSHHARRFLGDLPKPEAESITGLSPTIAIGQKLSIRTPRSTVGTMTGIYDYLRVLFARIGVPYCPVSGEKVAVQSREKILARLKSLPPKSKLILLSPYARAKKAEFKEDFAELLRKGFTRVRVDGDWIDLSETQGLDGNTAHDVDLVIDRLTVADARLAEAATLALETGNGTFSVFNADTKEETLFSEHAYSPKSGLSYGPLSPQDFSFNHPAGMCPNCHGLGVAQEFDLSRVIDPEKSISEDCCQVGSSYTTIRYRNIYDNLARLFRFKVSTPWKDLKEEAKQIFLYGVKGKALRMIFQHPEKGSRWIEFVRWPGVLQEAKSRLIAAKSELYRKKMSLFMCESICPECRGARVKPYPASAQFCGKTISEIAALSLDDACAFFEKAQLDELDFIVAQELLKEIKGRIKALLRVGLDYLTLERSAPTLSGGESQRVRIASQIGAGLVGAIYVLDEPSIGLHPADHHKLIETLLSLKDQGNTLLVVEHDLETMLAADTIIDVGPGAGVEGGRILAQGSLEDLKKSPESLTGAYLSGRLKLDMPQKRRKSIAHLELFGCQHHNLKNIDVSIPLGVFVCITGVSGSGKSSLISDTLAPLLAQKLHQATEPVGKFREAVGLEHLDKAIAIDQSPIGRTPRSNAATYIKLFDDIRELFAQLPESKLRGLSASRFSFNAKEGGACSYCNGLGIVKINMDFLEDAESECPQCKGRRFDPEILQIRFKGKNIHEILQLCVADALVLFDALPQIRRKLEVLEKVGLAYLSLGQPSTTLSGGEAQRVKLAKELVRPSTKRTLYILDEPTTGLHFHDINKLARVLQELVDKGSSMIVIEHQLDLIKMADWIIDLGPQAGVKGGKIIGAGTPEQIAKLSTPTGKALAEQIEIKKTAHKKQKPIQTIEITNAEQNTLKNVSISIPRNSITVFTGPSGSGKSSLAFETLYAEGQRRYAETLPAYARQALEQLPKAKVDEITGLSPAIALEQKTGGLNPRSTIGTITEIYDYLRILYAHLGDAFCPETGDPIRQISKDFILEKVLKLPLGEKIQILTPLENPKDFAQMADRLNREGFLRIRLNGTTYSLDDEIPFAKHLKNELYLIIDRLTVDPKSKDRLLESIAKAAERSDGIVVIAREKEDLYFNLAFAVEKTGKSYPPLTPHTFSFNAQSGMCLECQGLGVTYGAHMTEDKAFFRRSLFQILTKLWQEKVDAAAYFCDAFFEKIGINPNVPLKTLTKEQIHFIFRGGDAEFKGLRWIGLETAFERYGRLSKSAIRQLILPHLSAKPCPACEGERLNPLARNVKINGLSLPRLCSLTIREAADFVAKIDLDGKKELLGETLKEIRKQIDFLLEIGLYYLTLDRSAPTLSGGELQRIRLARQLGSTLTSCLYVLDEPTIGLHPHNSDLLLKALNKLRDLGNTLVLVEHDPLIVKAADYLFDFGPGAGKLGGKIVASGTLPQILKNPNSLTGLYLSGKKRIAWPKKRRPFSPDILIENANLHNLKNITAALPKGAITCFTGVSGSGKSTLVRQLLKPAAEKALHSKKIPIEYLGATFHGLDIFEKVITVDQSPIGQTARADVSSYTEIQPLLRSHFASLPQAKTKGLQPRHFSPNHLSGMCRTCWGLGMRTIDLQFLPAVKITCDACKGERLNPLSLEILYKGKNFGKILELTVQEAIEWFSAIPKIVKKLQTLIDVGLSYVQLGQGVATLSGGEAQRLRLSRELSRISNGTTLYLIDEPTVGLHSEDIAKLLPIFHKLADKKNTLILIEHNLDVIANADYLIDLGPEAGLDGGSIVATGTPEEVSKVKKSHTGRYLQQVLSNQNRSENTGI